MSLAILIGREFEVLTSSNGMEGLAAYEKNHVSLILLDIDMPVMNGIEMLEELRKKDEKIKVMIMTGRSCHEYAMKCANLNVQGYIEKPADPEELIAKMKKVLGISDCPVLKDFWKNEYEMKAESISPIIKRTISFVYENFHKDMTREDISAYLEISPDHLCKTLRKECGLSITNYINRYKIYKSREYLIDMPHMTISQIAEEVGITDANYFSRLFKKYTGLTPGEFKRKNPAI